MLSSSTLTNLKTLSLVLNCNKKDNKLLRNTNVTKNNIAQLFYNNIDISSNSTSFCEYNQSSTQNNGYELYINNNGNIVFNDLSNCLVEIYAHCDITPSDNSHDNFLTMDLSGISVAENSLGVLDIDTRSVSKTTTFHNSYGPTMYKILDHTKFDENNTYNKTICNTNVYKLRVQNGKEVNLSEIKLTIKVINIY